ncbi:MAG TPA: hypothetical protein VEZ90_17530 [Blastocatellia bacterium]|nr:hypothetical protein [Blastocatellia bacterium]
MIRDFRILTISLFFAAVVASTGCSIRGAATSVPPRMFREIHGLRVRSYTLVPVTEDLSRYRAAEIRPLDNLMLDQIPERCVQRLNSRLMERIRALGRFEQVRVPDSQTNGPLSDSNADRGAEAAATLVVEGYIDDYTPGIPKLRLVEKGDNHAVLTVRILLKDKSTSEILGESNITVENSRVTSNVDRMVDKEAAEIAKYVRGRARVNRNEEVVANEY